ncbi:MAG: phosphatase PAP2 family protein [Bacteroidetes bacterium]|nr:phosphatase PAP2 family protein [Bacteroidota bacterium]MCL5737889.1 phosphatase PAP2 family protein [Bacteroidota bacterium]
MLTRLVPLSLFFVLSIWIPAAQGKAVGGDTSCAKPSSKLAALKSAGQNCDLKNLMTRFKDDFASQGSAFFKMGQVHPYYFSGALALTTILMYTDQSSYNSLKRLQYHNRWIDKPSAILTGLGSSYGLGLLAGFAGYSLLFKDKKAQDVSLLATESFVTSGVWVIAIKWMTGRERPSATGSFSHESGGEWAGPLAYFWRTDGRSISSFDSFPSGHTATAFSLAAVFATEYKDYPAVPVICYGVASLVGISRIFRDAHWLSDVFVGGLIGFLSAKIVIQNNNQDYVDSTLLHSGSQWKLSVTPVFFGQNVGIGVKVDF